MMAGARSHRASQTRHAGLPILTVGSLFAGIGGFDLAFERAGFRVIWQAEQDGKAQSVLSARFPDARLYDDVKAIGDNAEQVDVICGGFPCQDVSVAGKREGLSGERTGLFWEVVRIARLKQPRWMVLENVPGLLSSAYGRDFGVILQALVELGYGLAWRILDSRYFGVAQRRRRVFLVLRAGGFSDGPGAVLFESESGEGHLAEGREAGKVATDDASDSPGEPFTFDWQAGSNGDTSWNGKARSWIDDKPGRTRSLTANRTLAVMQPYVPIAGPLGVGNDGIGRRSEDDPNLVAVGVHANQRGELRTSDLAGSLNGSLSGKQFEGVFAMLNSGGNDGVFRTEPGEHLVVPIQYAEPQGGGGAMGVRRLTPLECERLQGFPDGWTCLCGKGHQGSRFCECADSPRYRQLGNAVTVNVAQWIAQRIAQVEATA